MLSREKYIFGIAYQIATGQYVRLCTPDAEIDEALELLRRAGLGDPVNSMALAA